MYKKTLAALLLVTIFCMGLVLPVIAGGDHDHADLEVHASDDHCDTPTKVLNIHSPDDGTQDYDQDEYQVDKDTCYEFRFHNNDPMVDHDVNLEHYEDAGMMEVHLHAANNSGGEHNNGTTTMNVMTPAEDTELVLYCSVAGHRSNGMEAVLVVGEGDSSLPFNWTFFLVGLFAMATVVTKVRSTKN